MVNLSVDVKDGLSPAILEFLKTIENPEDMHEAGGRQASQKAKEWHAEYGKAGGWRGKNYLGSGAGKSGEFGQSIALGWQLHSHDEDGAVISNEADYYYHKVHGGTITPKNAEALTIPIVAEAVGRRAKDYVTFSGNVLFKIKGMSALFEAIEGGGVRAIYSLRKSVTHDPSPEALPDEEVLAEAFTSGWRSSLFDKIQNS